jgi:hypothetical protein
MVGPKRLLARATLIALAVGCLPRVAAGMVTQPPPGNEVMPQPANPYEVLIVTSRGFPDDALTLAGLFKYFGGGADSALDPVRDAQTTPGTFAPTCGLTAQLVLRGGECNSALGWYNATEPPTLPTAIYPFVPGKLGGAPPNGLSCADSGFCPLATRTTTQVGQHTWSDPLHEFDPGIRTDARWTGGKVGLALVGVAGSLCPQTKYSQAELNDKSPAGAPWVTALVYQSVAEAGARYLAFEDAPTCAPSWRGCTGTQPNVVGKGNDADFNDAVFYVRETPCPSDGGVPAGTGGAGGSGAAGTGGVGGSAGATGVGGSAGTPGAGGSAGATGVGGSAGTPGAGGAAGALGTAGTGATAGTTGGASGTAGAPGTAGTGATAGTTGGASGTAGAGGASGPGGGGGMTGGAGSASAGSAGASTSGGGCGCDLASGGSGAWSLLLALALVRRRRHLKRG